MDPIEEFPDKEFPVKVNCNPTIATFPSGKTFAIAGSTWIQVPSGSTRADLPKWMKWTPPPTAADIVKVEGSKGNAYTVRRNKATGNITCTCPGFKYREKCKHLAKAFGE
jgi:hypothetical protein|tara:strand:+ start:156 stop:485 length:330 start_codon:yes stop_codon:yes gene_type:complete